MAQVFRGVTMDDLARNWGMSKKDSLSPFPSKSALCRPVVETSAQWPRPAFGEISCQFSPISWRLEALLAACDGIRRSFQRPHRGTCEQRGAGPFRR